MGRHRKVHKLLKQWNKQARGAAAWHAPLRIGAIAAVLLGAATWPLTASAQPQPQPPRGSVAEFLDRAEPLMAMGPLALAHPDADRLKAQVIDAARRYKSRNDAQKRAGHARTSCPPDAGDLDPQDWLRHLRSISAPKRRTTNLTTAFEQFMDKRFPCPAVR